MCLKNKRILITAGPTWVPIDEVRVISNTASGATGILLAEKLSRLGAKVTLLLGPAPFVGAGLKPAPTAETCNAGARHAVPLRKNIKIIRFHFFDELKKFISTELESAKYDAVIHSAAVADYRPRKPRRQKIRSGLKHLRLDLVPTEKIIDSIKKRNSSLYLVGFKFEPSDSKAVLIREAAVLARRSRADLVVANTTVKDKYLAYFVKGRTISGPMTCKTEMTHQLCKMLKEGLCRS